jgi:hypothetical protein
MQAKSHLIMKKIYIYIYIYMKFKIKKWSVEALINPLKVWNEAQLIREDREMFAFPVRFSSFTI